MSFLPPFTHLNADHLPDSVLAEELRAGVSRMRFEPGLEAQYRTSDLRRLRLRVRLWFSLGVALSVVYAVVQASRTGLSSVDFGIVFLVIFPCALALAWLAWPPEDERLFFRS